MHACVPRILSVGTALPKTYYTQQDILDLFRVENPVVRKIFAISYQGGISSWAEWAGWTTEVQSELLEKHRRGLGFGRKSHKKGFGKISATTQELTCFAVSSTGFMLPGLTAMFIKHLGFRVNCHRMDLVGMGCNAGLNGLNPVTSWVKSNPKTCIDGLLWNQFGTLCFR